MTSIRTSTGNSKHLPQRYSCKHCGNVLSIRKKFFLTECGKCKRLLRAEDLIDSNENE